METLCVVFQLKFTFTKQNGTSFTFTFSDCRLKSSPVHTTEKKPSTLQTVYKTGSYSDPIQILKHFKYYFKIYFKVLNIEFILHNELCRGRPRLHVAGQRVVGVLKVARGRRSTSMVSVSTVSYRRPWSVGSVPRHLIFHAVIRV